MIARSGTVRLALLLGFAALPMLAQVGTAEARPSFPAGTPKRVDTQKLLCRPGLTFWHGRCVRMHGHPRPGAPSAVGGGVGRR